MSKQISNQLNLKFTGEAKAQLLQDLEQYLADRKITKADFVAAAIEQAITNDLAASHAIAPAPAASDMRDSVKQMERQIDDILERLGKLSGARSDRISKSCETL